MESSHREEYNKEVYVFCSKPQSLLYCQICHDLLVNPQETTCCGKAFCLNCLEKWKKGSHRPSCPVCRCSGLEYNVSRTTQRMIKSLTVYCRFKSIGCQWTGELCDHESHVKSSHSCQEKVGTDTTDTKELEKKFDKNIADLEKAFERKLQLATEGFNDKILALDRKCKSLEKEHALASNLAIVAFVDRLLDVKPPDIVFSVPMESPDTQEAVTFINGGTEICFTFNWVGNILKAYSEMENAYYEDKEFILTLVNPYDTKMNRDYKFKINASASHKSHTLEIMKVTKLRSEEFVFFNHLIFVCTDRNRNDDDDDSSDDGYTYTYTY